jgi:3-oxoadipate enol-lactonase
VKIELPDAAGFFCADRGSGPTVVFLHGFPLDHRMWEGQFGALAESHRVVAPDLRGLGQSGGAGEVVTMEQMADDAAALLDAIGAAGPVVVCGLSMGGYVAFEFWRRHGARLCGLVLCDTRAEADAPEAAEARRETAERVRREGTGFLTDAMIPRLLAPETLERETEVVQLVRRMIHEAPPQGTAAASLGMARRADATPWLPEIDCPALVLGGRQDAVTPVDSMRAMARAMPRARLVEIPHAGHMAPLERPAECNAAMREFLAELP